MDSFLYKKFIEFVQHETANKIGGKNEKPKREKNTTKINIVFVNCKLTFSLFKH